jgi:hypothetical protein
MFPISRAQFGAIPAPIRKQDMKPDDEVLRKLVEDYIRKYRPQALKEVGYFKTLLRLEVAILDAVKVNPINGKKHDHQWKIPARLLHEFSLRLQDVKEELRAAANFDALHSLIAREAGKGIGPLTIYDVAHRIGAYLGLEPTLVYLHAGTAVGAKRLGFTGQTIDPRDLPSVLSVLTPAEIEDWLCIYKDQLIGEKKTSRCFRVESVSSC